MSDYDEFVKAKAKFDKHYGFDVADEEVNPTLLPHQRAIVRWSVKGGRRLSARFVEWMMGLPEGWVTDPALGLSRVQQLKMLGNGVVTQQALYALRLAEVAG